MKPDKPYPEFPLFAHPNGQWAKKIRGKPHYFGVWEDWQAALNTYQEQRDDLYAGRTPANGEGLTLRQLVNHYLTSKARKRDSGDLTERTYQEYYANCERVLKVLGKSTHVENLRPIDFGKLRSDFAKTHGAVTLLGDIQRTRVLFKYADDNFRIRVNYGQEFDKPTRTKLRKARNDREPKFIDSPDIRKIIAAAGPHLRAMVYLAVNAGFGNLDCARLQIGKIDLDGGWINFPRPKTGIGRRCPLWPETVKALQASIAKRPLPIESAKDHVFLTKYKNTWEPKTLRDDPVGKEFTKLLKELGIHRKGVGFYALRHVFQTIGARTLDKDAVRAIMGHADDANDMSAVYTEGPVEDSRLLTVSNYVRKWLKRTR